MSPKCDTLCAKLQVQMRQEDNDVMFRVLARGAGALPCGDAAALHDYFNLGSRMAELTAHWAERDPRFRNIHPYFPGLHGQHFITCGSFQSMR